MAEPEWWGLVAGARPAPAPAARPGGGTAAPYLPQIREAAGRHGVDPALLAGLVDYESSGRPAAISAAGAVGLGQVMPREAGFAGRPTRQELLDPATNLDWSARILAENRRRWGTDEQALAAYLGTINRQGQITGGDPYTGVSGNRYVQTVLERRGRYAGATPPPNGQGATPRATPTPSASPGASPEWWSLVGGTQAPSPASTPNRPGRAAAPSGGGGAVFPVAGYTGQVQLHHGDQKATGGSDLMAAEGTPVLAMVPGRVRWATYEPVGGHNVGILGDDGLTYYYAHLRDAPAVKAGQQVAAGTPLGAVGRTGNAANTPPHLHLGIGRGIQQGVGSQGGLGRDFDAVAYLRQTLTGALRRTPTRLRRASSSSSVPEWWALVRRT